MCGLAGFLQANGLVSEQPHALAARMGERIAHRGPDDSGVWLDANAGISLAHRRLSILDLSPAGHQPMVSVSGRYVIVFNGEIYNHLGLRRELGILSGVGIRIPKPSWQGLKRGESKPCSRRWWGCLPLPYGTGRSGC